jgi:hypothetical protein
MYKAIKQLTEKDHIVFRMLAACGNASTAALQATGVSISRIQCYQKEGLIGQITYQNTRSRRMAAFVSDSSPPTSLFKIA